MEDAHLERLLLLGTMIQLQVEEYFAPDLGPPEDYLGPHLVATAHAGRLAMLSSEGQLARELSFGTMAALLQAATLAQEEQVREGFDTATGRTLTRLQLRVDHPRGGKRSFICRGIINHLLPHALPPQWSAVLRTMRDVAGVLGEGAASAWDRALTWTSPVELGPTFTAGAAMRLPHRVTSFAHDGELYLRTGQPPQRSSLYLFSNGVLTCVDDGHVIPPNEGRFILPCGGARLTLRREWQKPLRFVIRCNDDRGIYVQRG